MATLQDAIILIRQGRKPEAQKILQDVLRANPQDVSAWFWFAETFDALDKRLKVLETCLQMNPGHPQALMALDLLRKKMAAPPSAPLIAQPVPPPVASPPPAPPRQEARSMFQSDSSGSVASLDWDAIQRDAEMPPARESHSSGIGLEDKPSPSAAFDWDALERETAEKKAARDSASRPPVNWNAVEQAVEQPQASIRPRESVQEMEQFAIQEEIRSRERIPERSYAFYQVWWTAVSNSSERAWASLLADPKADAWRALEWVIYIGLTANLLGSFGVYFQLQQLIQSDPDFRRAIAPLAGLLENSNTALGLLIFVGLYVLLGALGTLLNFSISVGVQHLICKLFGGKGRYGKLFYAVAAYAMPVTLVSNIVSLVPCVGGLAAGGLGLYSIALNVRAVSAAHRLETPRALMVVLLPTILVLLFLCVIGSQLFFYLQSQGVGFPSS